MATKCVICTNCCPEGGAIHEATFDIDGKPIWRCNNCHQETRRLVQRRPDESTPLTQSQIDAITRIQQYNVRDGYEVKQFHLCNLGAKASVVVEVGRKGDEGTAGAIFCRQRGHFFVGRQGRIEALDGENKDGAKRHPLIYGWRH